MASPQHVSPGDLFTNGQLAGGMHGINGVELSSEDDSCSNFPGTSLNIDFKSKLPLKPVYRTPKHASSKPVSQLNLHHIFSFTAEIVNLIVTQLEPLTLIALSRTMRMSRNYLVGPDRGQKDHLWRIVRRQTGLPDLTARDISNREYLLLVFDRHCHDCFAPNVTRVNFVNCARLCTSCHALTKVKTQKQRKRLLEKLHPASEACSKHTSDPGCYIPRGIERISKKLYSLKGKDLTAFIEERTKLKKAIETDAKAITNWIVLNSKSAILPARASPKARRIGGAHTTEERIQIVEKRRNDIKKKLLGLGWTNQTLSFFWTFPGVSDPVTLTESEWSKIQHSLVTHLRRSLLKRRTDEARSAIPYSDMLQNDPCSDLFPPYDIFIHFECVKAVWDTDESTDTPIELEPFTPFHPDIWAAALPEIRAAVAKYQDRIIILAEERLVAAYISRGMSIPINPLTSLIPRWRYFPGSTRFHSIGKFVNGTTPHTIARFPRIHALMRDQPTNIGSPNRLHRASLFESITMKPAGAKRDLSWDLDRFQWLWVDLDGSESVL
ncbi:hypothetical protein DL96DRAFT_1789160 [Flagelloscypha sp. PMI_526]|nr:hypothetical protein DL96DRAFT_1789160 [Flagelloscypha sp. PMI_526]